MSTTAQMNQTARMDIQGRAAERYEEKDFGFWLYLMSDAVIFACLFATYLIMVGNAAGGPEPNDVFSLDRAAAETALLLLSSATFGIAAVSLSAGERSKVILWLGITFLLGIGFIYLEFDEFRGMIAEGAGPHRSGFLSAFFTLVGTHGLHVSVGLFWILVMIGQVFFKGLTAPVASRLMRLGMFWHFLDIIWVVIFSVVYLPGLI
ncbi:MAG: cytochrome o ubiquinol oxidase subunit III [Pseudomonadota bacterium]